jgi:hypothetical protein
MLPQQVVSSPGQKTSSPNPGESSWPPAKPKTQVPKTGTRAPGDQERMLLDGTRVLPGGQMTKKSKEPDHKATRPESIPEKFDECKFFLGAMDANKDKRPIREFLWYLSAFLCAYRSLWWRLLDILRHLKRDNDAKVLGEKLRSDRDIDWPRRLRNLEVHGDGVTVWSPPPFGNPLEPALGYGLYPDNLTERCRIALRKMESIIRDSAVLQ